MKQQVKVETELENINSYKISIVLLKEILSEGLISHEEYHKSKNDFKKIYKIKEDITFLG